MSKRCSWLCAGCSSSDCQILSLREEEVFTVLNLMAAWAGDQCQSGADTSGHVPQ